MNEETRPEIVAPDGRPARRRESDSCPGCGASRDKRVNAAGFGPPVITCGACGLVLQGETEC